MDKITKLYLRSRWFYNHKNIFMAKIIHRWIRFAYSCEVPYSASIDKTVRFAHNGLGVVINSSATICENVVIYQNVTIGNRNSSEAPTIKKNTLIGAGALIIGNVTIGENCKIGAGAIVVDNIPNNSVVCSEKSRIIKTIK